MTNLEGPRPARPEELAEILVLANHVMRAGRQPTFATDYSFIYSPQNAHNIIVVKDSDRVVSMAGIWMNTMEAGDGRIRVGGINCLATLPGYRGHGLATKIMQAGVAHMASAGCQLGRLTTSISDWYHRLGWENTGSLYAYRLNHSNIGLLPTLPEGVTVTYGTEFHDEAIAAIVRLRQTDRLGGARTPEIMRQLLKADNDPNLMGNTRYVIARQDGTPLAYCLDTDHGIVEWGGPAELVAGLVRGWFVQRVGKRGQRLALESQDEVLASQELTLVAPAAGHPFMDILRSLALPGHHDYWGMLYIIDPRGILDSFGLPEIAVREANGQFTLTRGDEFISVTRPGLAKLLFGPERTSDFARDALPLLFWEWPTEHV